MASNKVKFNVKNVYYAKVTETDGAISYDAPKPIKGAVSISLDPQGDTKTFYADGISYYTTTTNQGYQGDLEVAMIPEDFEKDILGVTAKDDVLVEDSTVKTVQFALLFQFDGDQTDIKHCLYNCVAARPNIESQTNEDTKEVRTEKLTITASPRSDGIVKSKVSSSEAAAYDTWFTKVFDPKGE